MRPAAWLRSARVPTKPLRAVPTGVLAAAALAFSGQLAWHGFTAAPRAETRHLPPAPSTSTLRVAALGEPAVLARISLLWLQGFDQQPGRSLSFKALDYQRLRAWLQRALDLSPMSDYPLLLAVRLYAQVTDPPRQRIMLDFAAQAFRERPVARWRWLAEASLIAQYRLHDQALALRYARALDAHTQPGSIPYWARDLQVNLLRTMGKRSAERALIRRWLADPRLTDPRERRFLARRLRALSPGNQGTTVPRE